MRSGLIGVSYDHKVLVLCGNAFGGWTQGRFKTQKRDLNAKPDAVVFVSMSRRQYYEVDDSVWGTTRI